VNRLPAEALARVAGVSLLGLSDTAAFEFHVSSWLGGGGDPDRRTGPEVARMTVPVTCVEGADDSDSACRAAEGPRVRVVPVAGGHHFGGDYARLAEIILGATPPP
jgi:type IV secretory pathway VirJ component